jgi:hypothetical protein
MLGGNTEETVEAGMRRLGSHEEGRAEAERKLGGEGRGWEEEDRVGRGRKGRGQEDTRKRKVEDRV